MIAAEIGGDGEEPGANIRVRIQSPVGPVRSQKRLLGEIFRLGRARRDPPEIAIDLAVMRADDRLERLCTHHLFRHRWSPVVKTTRGLST